MSPSIEGNCLPGGPLNARPLPYPIGEGLARTVTPPLVRAPKPKTKPLTIDQRNTYVAADYEAGVPVITIANRYGISRTHVYDLLKAAGITTRGNR